MVELRAAGDGLLVASLASLGGFMKDPRDAEENDIPFLRNELRDFPGTMNKPLDTADAPGKADSEMAEDELDH